MKTATINGKQINYTEDTKFYLQVGKGSSSYRTVATFVGNLAGAVIHFNGLNIFDGYKKRLYSPDMENPILYRVLT